MNFNDKVALVTGGSSGLGNAIVLALAKAGCHVVFTYNSKEKEAQETVAEICREGVKGLAIKVDMHSEEEVHQLFNALTKNSTIWTSWLTTQALTARANYSAWVPGKRCSK